MLFLLPAIEEEVAVLAIFSGCDLVLKWWIACSIYSKKQKKNN